MESNNFYDEPYILYYRNVIESGKGWDLRELTPSIFRGADIEDRLRVVGDYFREKHFIFSDGRIHEVEDIVRFTNTLTGYRGSGVVKYKRASHFVDCEDLAGFTWADLRLSVVGSIFDGWKIGKIEEDINDKQR